MKWYLNFRIAVGRLEREAGCGESKCKDPGAGWSSPGLAALGERMEWGVVGRGWGGRKGLSQAGLLDLKKPLFFPFLLSHFLPPSCPLYLPPSLPSFLFFPSCLFSQALGQGLGPVSFFRLLPLCPSPLLSPPPPLPNCCPAPTGPALPPTTPSPPAQPLPSPWQWERAPWAQLSPALSL